MAQQILAEVLDAFECATKELSRVAANLLLLGSHLLRCEVIRCATQPLAKESADLYRTHNHRVKSLLGFLYMLNTVTMTGMSSKDTSGSKAKLCMRLGHVAHHMNWDPQAIPCKHL